MKNLLLGLLLIGVLSCQKNEPASKPEILDIPPQYKLDEKNGCYYQSGIVGGKPVSSSDPFKNKTVLIWNEFEDASAPADKKLKVEICTGTLIDRKVILTAAHCISEPKSKTFVIFNNSLLCSEGMNKKLAYRTLKSVMNPIWEKAWQADPKLSEHMNSETNNGDLALLLLEKPAPTDYPTIDLWTTEPIPLNSGLLIQIGYGRTATKEESSLPTLRMAEKNISNIGRNRSSDHFVVEQKNGVGGCLGDSGGPLFLKNDNKLFQIGVASFIRGSESKLCETGDLFYENLSTYSDWISETKKSLLKR